MNWGNPDGWVLGYGSFALSCEVLHLGCCVIG
jgi:hypothetical protein